MCSHTPIVQTEQPGVENNCADEQPGVEKTHELHMQHCKRSPTTHCHSHQELRISSSQYSSLELQTVKEETNTTRGSKLQVLIQEYQCPRAHHNTVKELLVRTRILYNKINESWSLFNEPSCTLITSLHTPSTGDLPQNMSGQTCTDRSCAALSHATSAHVQDSHQTKPEARWHSQKRSLQQHQSGTA